MPRTDTIFGEAHLGPLARAGNVPFVLLILLYRITLSPFLGRQCRFEPTCSLFGLGAYRRFGPGRGTWMTTCRLCRCHPFHKGGYDPVPLHPHEIGNEAVHCESGESVAANPLREIGAGAKTRSGVQPGVFPGEVATPGNARHGKDEEKPGTGQHQP